MKIGFSLSRCVNDIVQGKVPVEEVVVIVSRTAFPNRDKFLEAADIYVNKTRDVQGTEDECRSVLEYLWDNGRIYQPRTMGVELLPPSHDYIWMDLFPTTLDGQNAEQVQRAWNQYRMALRLTAPDMPDAKGADQVLRHY